MFTCRTILRCIIIFILIVKNLLSVLFRTTLMIHTVTKLAYLAQIFSP